MKKMLTWFAGGGFVWLAVTQPDTAVKLVHGAAGGVVGAWSGIAHLIAIL